MEEPDAWSSRADEDGGQTPAGSEKLAVSNTWTIYMYILMLRNSAIDAASER